MTPSRHRRLVLAYDSNPSSDGSVLVSATPPARHHYCPPTPLRPRPHPQSRVESGHALSHTTTCHLSTSWRIRMNISRCVPGREQPKGCIVPTCTPARARGAAVGQTGHLGLATSQMPQAIRTAARLLYPKPFRRRHRHPIRWRSAVTDKLLFFRGEGVATLRPSVFRDDICRDSIPTCRHSIPRRVKNDS